MKKQFNIDRIHDNEILSDLLNYSKKKKAEAIYYKCLRLNKTQLADKIRVKYGLDVNFDLVMASAWALAAKQKKGGKR